jgi:hypothetical protein
MPASEKDRSAYIFLKIIGVLLVGGLLFFLVVGPEIDRDYCGCSADDNVRAMARHIASARARWSTVTKRDCPASIDDLKAELGRRPGDSVLDEWGHPYVLQCGATACEEGFCAVSKGKDGVLGTADDVSSAPRSP